MSGRRAPALEGRRDQLALRPRPSVSSGSAGCGGRHGRHRQRAFLRSAGPGSKAVICDISGSHDGGGASRRLGRQRALGPRERSPKAMPRRCRSGGGAFQSLYHRVRHQERAENPKRAQRSIPCAEAGRSAFYASNFQPRRCAGAWTRSTGNIRTPIEVPVLGRVVAGDAEPLPLSRGSIPKFPEPAQASPPMMEDAGFVRVQYRNLSAVLQPCHLGIKA